MRIVSSLNIKPLIPVSVVYMLNTYNYPPFQIITHRSPRLPAHQHLIPPPSRDSPQHKRLERREACQARRQSPRALGADTVVAALV